MLPKNQKLIPRSRELRKQATKEERHLWYDYLRTCEETWNRQKVIGHFIVDFFCNKAALVIELDGSQHYTEDAQAYDLERSAYLEEQGLMVLRFSNSDVQNSFSVVCEVIAQTVSERTKQ